MALWQGLILNGTEVVNNPTVVGDADFQTPNPTIFMGTNPARLSIYRNSVFGQTVVGMSTDNQIVFTTYANYLKDFDHVPQLTPTLYIHSAADPDVSPNQFTQIWHDGTNTRITDGTGATGQIWLWGTAIQCIGGTTYVDGLVCDNYPIILNSGGFNYFEIYPSADDGVQLGVGYSDNQANRNIIITDNANIGKDHDHDTLSANPTLFIHSVTDPDVNNTQWVSLSHDQTNAVIGVGKGSLVVTVPAIGGQLLAPTGDLLVQPGISFNGFPDTGIGTDGNNSRLHQ
jgi:hypothetical protein